MYTIRLAVPADLPRLVAIHNQAILAGNANAYTEPFSVAARRDWFEAHDPNSYPIYVCEWEGQVAGWLSLSSYRDRPVLRRTVEVSYYVDYSLHGKGIASALMQHALDDCGRVGRKVLVAIVLERNEASIKLLEKFGFEKWGYLPEVAELDGRLCGHLYYGRKVDDPGIQA